MLIGTGMYGFGASYYFSTEAPSLYILGAYGKGDIHSYGHSKTFFDEASGDAFMLGGGYEFSSHLHLEATFIRIFDIEESYTVQIDADSFERGDVEATTFQITINYLWY